MMFKTTLAAALLALSAAGSAFADAIPYPGVGTVNAETYTFTAASDGPIMAYFLGTGASYTEQLGLIVNGVDTGILGLNNHTSALGDVQDFGLVSAGDTLVFYIHVDNLASNWYSDVAMNSDGTNHVYSTSFSGAGGVPAGTYVAFEDLPFAGSDFNYFDETFSFTNVATTPSIPEPGNLVLLMAGLGALGIVARRRRS
jgi:hypothetical protein